MNAFRVKRAATGDDATFIVLGTFEGQKNTRYDNEGGVTSTEPCTYFLVANEKTGNIRYLEIADFAGHYEYIPEETTSGFIIDWGENDVKVNKIVDKITEKFATKFVMTHGFDPGDDKERIARIKPPFDPEAVESLDAEDPRSHG